MSQILQAVVEFFEEDDWPYSVLDKDRLYVNFNGDNGKWTCLAQVLEERHQFVFYSILPVNVPEDRRQAVAEYITRANFGLVLGNFEMDFSDGETRFKTSIDVRDDRLTPTLVKHLVYHNVLTADKYLPGLMAVIYAAADPAEAIARVEQG